MTKKELELENSKLRLENERLKDCLEDFNTNTLLSELNNGLEQKSKIKNKNYDIIDATNEFRRNMSLLGFSKTQTDELIMRMIIDNFRNQ